MPSARFSDGVSTHVISEVSCNGSEPRLLDCPFLTSGSSCGVSEDAAIVCQGRNSIVWCVCDAATKLSP